MLPRGARLAVVCAAVVAVAACSLLTNLDGYTATDHGGADATTDPLLASGEAAAPDSGGPALDASADADADAAKDAADAMTYVCPGGGNVTDCAACDAGAFPCVLCADAGANKSKTFGVCVTSQTSGSACQGRGPSGYDDCLCVAAPDPSPCVADYQICFAPFGPACRDCGFDGGAGQKCKGGGTCSASGVCQ